mgnify:CR=1 FL=1|tara:strand:+ start:210 stop:935 length:726 start_codon:yes stop_codon:yes gene_type:complete
MSSQTDKLNIKIFADGADISTFESLNKNNLISGFTTNPTLMRKVGIKNYKNFAKEILDIVKEKPVSFEVFADDIDEMEEQAFEISSWGKNVNIKIPITNTKKISTKNLIEKLSKNKIVCNVTAIFTLDQCAQVLEVLSVGTPAILSIFAGRIADTGIDPMPIMKEAVKLSKSKNSVEILWASPRELLNLIQANDIGCQIITMPNDLINKISLIGKDLDEYSLETVLMFYNDALKADFKIDG